MLLTNMHLSYRFGQVLVSLIRMWPKTIPFCLKLASRQPRQFEDFKVELFCLNLLDSPPLREIQGNFKSAKNETERKQISWQFVIFRKIRKKTWL